MIKFFLVCIIFTIIGAFGGFFFKKTASSSKSILKILFSPYLYVGGMLYVMGGLLNIWALKKLPYTVVLPLTSITYIWTMLISYFILKEKITKKKITGVLCIVLGAALLGFMHS